MKRPCLIPVLGVAVFLSAAGPAVAQEAPPPACSAPEASQFDFWVGEWDLTWGEKGRGSNTVTRILDGCVIQESFHGDMENGTVFDGLSVSTYNLERGIWQQTWVDSQGSYLDFEGGMDGDRMTLSREAERNGQKFLTRMVFKNIAEDSLDWDWERSTDGGETWELVWGIHYERRK
jgi:hypothetical protein